MTSSHNTIKKYNINKRPVTSNKISHANQKLNSSTEVIPFRYNTTINF